MTFKEKCAIAKRYVEQSNSHDLNAIETMLEKRAVYASPHVGRFQGITKIITMMANYFRNFPDGQS